MRRFICMAAALFLAAALFIPCKAREISAHSALMLDVATGRVLYEKNADQRSLIASTTKIMTALIVCEQCNVLDRMRIPKEAVGIEGSSLYLQPGEVLTIQELLYGMMLHSGNDAATALAIYCAGTVEGFAELMNDKARSLGLEDTHFTNPHGLDAPEHYSTARDLATLSAYAMKNPIFAQTVKAKQVSIGQRKLHNHNKLLWRLEGANGVKTGYTRAAGRILVSGACRDGRQLIAVTINAPDDWNDHAYLLEDGFARFAHTQIVWKDQHMGQLAVLGGTDEKVSLLAEEGFSFPLSKDEKISIELPGPGFVYAPVAEGAEAGYAHILVDGIGVGKVRLVFGGTVEQRKMQEKTWFQKLFGG